MLQLHSRYIVGKKQVLLNIYLNHYLIKSSDWYVYRNSSLLRILILFLYKPIAQYCIWLVPLKIESFGQNRQILICRECLLNCIP